MDIVGKWSHLVVALVLSVVFIPLFVSAEPVACCLQERSGFPSGFCYDYSRNLLTQSAIDACNAGANTFAYPNFLCSAVPGQTAPVLDACTIGCCCLTDANNNLVQDPTQVPVTRDLCSITPAPQGMQRQFLPLADLSDLQTQCDALCGVPGQPFNPPPTTCESLGYFWCSPGNSPGSIVDPDLISDEGTRGPLQCYDQACYSSNQCVDAGGVQIGTGQYCATDYINGIQGCCAPADVRDMTCSGVSPSGFGGVQCSLPNLCQGDDFTNQLTPAQRLLLGNNRCCENLGANSCSAPDQCVPRYGTPVELLCNDGIDDDCDLAVDEQDSDCSATITGTVVEYNPGGNEAPIANVLLRFTGDVSGIPDDDVYYTYSGTQGQFSISNVAAALYTPTLVEGQQNYRIAQGGEPFTLQRGASAQVNLKLEITGLHTLSGIVTDNLTGLPVQGALVYLANRPHQTYTDGSGRYNLSRIPAGQDYNLYAYHPQYLLSRRTLVDIPEQSTANIQLYQASCGPNATAPSLAGRIDRIGHFDLLLDWNPVTCNFERGVLYRCNGGQGQCTVSGNQLGLGDWTPVFWLTNGFDTSYLDEQTLPDRNYTYVLEIKHFGRLSMFSNVVTLFPGNEECEGRTATNQFCVKEFDADGTKLVDAGYLCTEENLYQMVWDGLDYVNCIDDALTCDEFTQNGLIRTQCVSSLDSCTQLSNIGDPFNLYANGLGPSNTESCLSIDIDPVAGNRCYYDVGDSNVNACLACNAQTTCNTYQSMETCLADPCSAGSGQNTCSWVPFNNDLRQGTCIDTQNPQCEDCQGANAILGTCPSREICEGGAFSAPGDQCYFNANDASCNSCEQVSCYDMTTQAACIGTDLTPGQFNFRTLSFTDPVPGKCGLNNCMWIANGPNAGSCVRDDDDRGQDDCALPQFRERFGLGISTTLCRDDKEPPTTNLVAPQYHDPDGITRLTFNVHESGVTFPDLTNTFFCIEQDGTNYCNDFARFELVPANGIVNLRNMSYNGTNLDYPLRLGENRIFYFSKDVFNNIEQMRTFNLTVDNQPPEIDLLVTVTQTADSLHSVLITADLRNGPAQCRLDIADNSNDSCFGTCDTYRDFRTSHTREIRSVPDGNYVAMATCRDAFDNEANATLPFSIDSDLRALHPTPSGPVDSNRVMLGIDTTQPKLCKYVIDQPDLFENIPNGQIIDNNPSATYNDATQLYEQRREVIFAPNEQHTIYFVCNYEPNTIDATTFTVDEIVPRAVIVDNFGNVLDNTSITQFVTHPRITLQCQDDPVNGFGCTDLLYCIVPISASSCTPLSYGVTSQQVNLEGSSTICMSARESTVNSMGGRSSTDSCYQVMLDTHPPRLFIDSYSAFTATGEVFVNGRVLDTLYARDSWNPQPEFIENAQVLQAQNFVFNARVVSPLDIIDRTPVLTFYFRYLNSQNYYALVVDAREQDSLGNPVVKIVEVRSGSVSVLNSGHFNSWDNNGMGVSIDVQGDLVKTSFGGFNISASSQYLASSSGRSFGVARGVTSTVTVSSVEVFDYDAQQQNRVLFRKRIGEGSWGPVESLDALPAFTILDTISPDNSLGVEYLLVGRDQANLESSPVTLLVQFDNEPPIVHNLTITQAPQDQNLGYVEYGTDAFFLINASDQEFYDDTSVKMVWVDIAGMPSSPILYNSTARRWKSVVPTNQLNYIGAVDVIVHVNDSVGNVRSRTFSGQNGLIIRDTINPFIQLKFETPYYTYNATPFFEINTSEPATCSITYDNYAGQEQTDGFSTQDLDHFVTLRSPILCGEGQSITTEAAIACTDLRDNTLTYLFDIICDRRPPVSGFDLSSSAGMMYNYTRTHKEFYLLADHTTSIRAVSDEPVQCRYCEVGTHGCDLNTPYDQMPGLFRSSVDGTYGLNDVTYSEFSVGSQPFEFYLLCKDTVGNIGLPRTLTITSLQDKPPVIMETMSNVSSSRFVNFYTYTKQQDATCVLSVSPGNIQAVMNKHNDYALIRTRHSYSVSLENGLYDVVMTCSIGDLQSQVGFPLTVNTSVPIINNLYPLPQQTFNALDALVHVSGNAAGASHVLFEKNGITVLKMPVHQLQNYAFNVSIGVPTGQSTIVVKAVSATGAVTQYAIFVERSGDPVHVEIDGLRGYSIQERMSNISILVSGPQAQGGTLELYRWQGTAMQHLGNRNVDASSAYVYDVNLQPGAHYFLGLVRKNDKIIAADNFVANIDPLSSELYSVSPRSWLYGTGQLRANIHYQNVIVNRLLTIGGTSYPVQQQLNDVTVDNLPSGTNIVNLSLTNDIGHSSGLVSLTTIDTTPPHLESYNIYGTTGIVTEFVLPIVELRFNEPAKILDAYLSNDQGRRFSFDSSYGVRKLITLESPLVDEGTYYITVQFEDQHGNDATDNTVSIQYVPGSFQLLLRQPEFGVSQSQPFTFQVMSSRQATCRWIQGDSAAPYEGMRPFDVSGNVFHTVNNFTIPSNYQENQPLPVTVLCVDSIGTPVNNTRHVFNVSVDSSPPVLGPIEVTPTVDNVVVHWVPEATLHVHANEQIICGYRELPYGPYIFDNDGYLNNAFANPFAFGVPVSDNMAYNIEVVCVNRAGLNSSQTRQFSTNFNAPATVSIVYPPDAPIGQQTGNVTVVTTKPTDVSGCTYQLNGGVVSPLTPQDNNYDRFYAGNVVFREGANNIDVTCMIEAMPYSRSRQFVVDLTPPRIHAVDDYNMTGSLSELQFSIDATDEFNGTPGSGIVQYEYEIGISSTNGSDRRSEAAGVTNRRTVTVDDLNLTVT